MAYFIFLLLNLHYCTGLKIDNAISSLQEDLKENLLFVVPVGSFERTVNVTKTNIAHLRARYPGRVDVVLLHYDSKQILWKEKTADALWYIANVQGSLESTGGKFSLIQKYLNEKTKIEQYAWIWAVDEDFDITGINISLMMKTAKETGSKITAPAVSFPHHKGKKKSSRLITKRHECRQGDSMCEFQTGNPNCKYSHVNFLEVMMPMFRAEALWKILTECDHCIHEDSLWGLDLVWCKFVAAKFEMKDDMKGCALLDQHQGLKLDFHTLPSVYHSTTALKDVKSKNSKYWTRQRRSKCVTFE